MRGGHLDAFAAGGGGDEGIVDQPAVPRQQREVEPGRAGYLGLLHDLDREGQLESRDAVDRAAVAGGHDNGPVGIAPDDPKFAADPHVPTRDSQGIRHGILDELVGPLGILGIELLLQIFEFVLHQYFTGEIFDQGRVDTLVVGGLPEGPAELRDLLWIGHDTGLAGLGDEAAGDRTAHGGTYEGNGPSVLFGQHPLVDRGALVVQLFWNGGFLLEIGNLDGNGPTLAWIVQIQIDGVALTFVGIPRIGDGAVPAVEFGGRFQSVENDSIANLVGTGLLLDGQCWLLSGSTASGSSSLGLCGVRLGGLLGHHLLRLLQLGRLGLDVLQSLLLDLHLTVVVPSTVVAAVHLIEQRFERLVVELLFGGRCAGIHRQMQQQSDEEGCADDAGVEQTDLA